MKRDEEAVHRKCDVCGKPTNISKGGKFEKYEFYECHDCANRRKRRKKNG